MHGRPREYKHKLKDPKAQEGYKKKVDAIRAGTALILQYRQRKQYDDVVMNAAAKLLKVVPEIYSIWNFRREALLPALQAGGAPAQAATATELALTQACLMENPKSYSTWHHRKWVVSFGACDLEAELALVSKALNEDSRNFHAWNYRQFLVRRMNRVLDQELEYSEDKIAQNFSNYSAWHYRSILLHATHTPGDDAQSDSTAQPISSGQHNLPPTPADLQSQGASRAGHMISSIPGLALGSASQRRPIPVEVLDEEYDMVHQAFATDSKDQSPWMYYRWLVGNSIAHVEMAAAEQGDDKEQHVMAERTILQGVLAREVHRMQQDHLTLEPDAKWPLLTLARLKEAQVRLGLLDEQDRGQIQEELKQLYTKLQQLDPMRSGYYQDALEGKAFVVVSALGTV